MFRYNHNRNTYAFALFVSGLKLEAAPYLGSVFASTFLMAGFNLYMISYKRTQHSMNSNVQFIQTHSHVTHAFDIEHFIVATLRVRFISYVVECFRLGDREGRVVVEYVRF